MPEEPGPRLYDLQADIGEKVDLAATHPETVRRLQQAYDAWNGRGVPPKWDNPERAAGRPAGALQSPDGGGGYCRVRTRAHSSQVTWPWV